MLGAGGGGEVDADGGFITSPSYVGCGIWGRSDDGVKGGGVLSTGTVPTITLSGSFDLSLGLTVM